MIEVPSILIVDDDEGTRRSLTLVLKKKGYRPATAETGQAALDLAQERFFNVALVDVHLPDVTGTELLLQLKELHPDLEVLLITGYASVENAVQAMAEGAYRYFVKPLNVDEVLAAIREALKKQRLIAEKRQAEAALRERNRVLALLNRASRALSSTLQPDQVLAIVLGEVCQLLDVAASSIWLLDPETNELVCRQAVGPQSDVVLGWRLAAGEGIAGWVAQHDESLIVPDTQADERHFKGVDRETGLTLRSILSVPLRFKQHMIGVLQALDTEVDRFDTVDQQLLAPLAASAAIAVQNAQLYEGAQREIAERRRVEQALRASEEKYRDLVENINDIIYAVDESGVITYISPVVEPLSGYRPSELIGRSFTELIHPEEMPHLLESFQRTLSGALEPHEYRVLTKSGEVRWARSSSRLIYEGDRIVGLRGSLTDITARKRAEERLRLLSSAVEQSTEGIAVSDLEGNLLFVNDAFAAMHGYAPQELAGKHLSTFHTSGQMPSVEAANRQIQETGEFSSEIWHVRRDGTVFPTLMHNSLLRDEIGNPLGVIGALRDITARKQAETVQHVLYQIANALHTTKDLNSLFRTIHQEISTVLNTKNFYIALYDEKSDKLSLPYLVDEQDQFDTFPAGKTLTAYVIKNDKPLLVTRKEIERLVQSGEVETIGAPTGVWLGVPLRTRDKVIGALAVQDYADETAIGEKELEILGFVSNQIAFSIERKRAQEALRESEQRFRDVARTIGDWIWETDAEGRYTYASPVVEQVLGYTPEEVLGKHYYDFFHPDEREELKTLAQETFQRKEPFVGLVNPNVHKDGRTVILETTGLPLTDATGNLLGYRGVDRDVTVRVWSEEILRALNAAAAAVQRAARTPEAVFTAVMEQLQALGLTSTIALLDETREQFVIRYVALPSRALARAEKLVGLKVVGYPLPVERLPIGRQILAGETVFVPDVAALVAPVVPAPARPLMPTAMRLLEVPQGVAAPLSVEGEVIGFLGVSVARMTEADVPAVTAFANQMAAALENAQLFEAEQRKAAQLGTIGEVGRQITLLLELGSLLDRFVNLVHETLNYYYVTIFLLDPATGELALGAGTGYEVEPAEVPRLRVGEEGICGWVAGSGEPLLVNDVSQEPRYYPVKAPLNTRSELAVPIRVKDQVIGVLDVQSAELDAFDEDDLFTLQALADQVSVAIENARLFEAEQQRRQEMETLRETALALTTSLDRNRVVERILAELQQVVPYDTASVQLLARSETGQGERLEVVGGRGFPNLPDLLGVSFPVDGSNPNSEVVRIRAPHIVEDAPAVYSQFRREPHVQAGIRSWLGVPMLVGDQFIGMIALDKREPGFYTAEHARLAEAFAAQAAIAIENARLYEETRQRTAQLEALREMGLELTAELNLDDLLHSIVSRAIDLVGGNKGGLDIYRPDRDVLEFAVHTGIDPMPSKTIFRRGEGLSGTVWESGEALIVDDYQRWVGRAALWDEYLGHSAIVGVPVHWGGEFLGVLEVMADPSRAFSPADADLLSLFATQAAIAIANARLFEAEREQRRLTEALGEAADIVSSTLELDQVLDRILEQVERVVPGDVFNIMLVEDNIARVARWRGYERLGIEGQIVGFSVPVTEYPSLVKMVQTGEPVVVPDTAADPDWVMEEGQEWRRSYVAAPIQVAGLTTGFLNVDSTRPGQFGPADARRLEAFANHAAIAVENAQLYRELRHHAEGLEQRVVERTGDLERRMVQLRVAAEVARDATTAQELEDLLYRAVNLVRDRFEFYHAGIFLLDERGEYAVLRAATGEVGRWMLADEHRLKVGEVGIVGHVTGSGQPRIALDVGADVVHFKNPLLPETRSEMALPLRVGERVIGALDVQSTQEAAFDEQDVAILQTMADQLAVAIENMERTAQIQAEFARLDAVLRSTSDGIIVTDEEGKILQGNPVAQAWLTQTLSPEDAARLREAVQELAQRAAERPEATLEFSGLDLQLNAAPIAVPGVGGAAAVVAVHDVSHLKALDRLKSRFVSNVSHELRTPVTTIRLYAALLRRSSPEKWEEYLDALEQESVRQTQLVEDILQISRVDAGRMEMKPEPIDLNELTAAIVVNHRALAQNEELALEHRPAEAGPVALVDPERMIQVLNNLVANAIQYTPQGGRVVVSTGKWEAEGRTWATTSVADTGIGIPAEELSHVFERFFRGEGPRQMQVPGTGLGLAIVREIVELHGGRVTVESQVGEGTTFTVWLPLAAE